MCLFCIQIDKEKITGQQAASLYRELVISEDNEHSQELKDKILEKFSEDESFNSIVTNWLLDDLIED